MGTKNPKHDGEHADGGRMAATRNHKSGSMNEPPPLSLVKDGDCSVENSIESADWPAVGLGNTNPLRQSSQIGQASSLPTDAVLDLRLHSQPKPIEPPRSQFRDAHDHPRFAAATPSIGSPEQMQALNLARKQGKKLRRAQSVASFNIWSCAICAAISGLIAVFSFSAAIGAIALGALAYNESRGRAALQRLELSAPRQLAINQMIFASLLILYAGWGIISTLQAAPVSDQYAQYSAEVQELMQPFDSVYLTASIAMYVGVGLFSLVFQGGTALYYITRRSHLERYLQETPEWILNLQRNGCSV